MNNKRLGTGFERWMCEYLAGRDWWVHFISPDVRGSQPFDIIAVRDDVPVAIDCKTCVDPIFRFSRLEDNQVNAFELWLRRGNTLAYVAVLYQKKLYMIHYKDLKEQLKIDLRTKEAFADGVLLR